MPLPFFPFPFECWHLLLGPSCSRWRIGPPLRLAYPPWRDSIGVSTFHTCEIRPGWAPLLPRGGGALPSRLRIVGWHLPFHNG